MDPIIQITVIMAAYNSGKTIGMSLDSVLRQNIPRDAIEILVIDGGSTDDTRKIAEEHGAVVLDNPDRLPEPAKRIGLRHARGKYVQIMDSDEVLSDDHIFEKRIRFLEDHPELITLLAGYISPEVLPPCGRYMSSIGDPFSAYVYRWYIDGNIGLIKKHDRLHDGSGYVGVFTDDDILPVSDSLTTVRMDHLKKYYDSIIDTENTSTIVQRIVEETHLMGHVKGDFVLHYTRSDFKTYLKKLKFRVINNVFDKNGSGYSARAVTNKKLQRRKYLYPLYCISLVMPVIDGIRMAIYYKHPVYLLHIVFAWYVLIEILAQYTKKLTGKVSRNSSYGF